MLHSLVFFLLLWYSAGMNERSGKLWSMSFEGGTEGAAAQRQFL